MNSKRVYFGMLGGIVLLIGLCAAGTYFANKMIVAEGDKLLNLKLEDAVAQKQEQTLEQAKKDIAKYEELEKIAKSVVPQEKDQARTVLELVNLAKEANINITSVQFPDSQLGDTAQKGGKNKSQVDKNTTQLTPVEGLKGVYTMEITIVTDPEDPVAYNQLISYLEKLENNRRTAQVSNISITPSETNRSEVTFSLSLTSYVKP